jgi:hypothetical protein
MLDGECHHERAGRRDDGTAEPEQEFLIHRLDEMMPVHCVSHCERIERPAGVFLPAAVFRDSFFPVGV